MTRWQGVISVLPVCGCTCPHAGVLYRVYTAGVGLRTAAYLGVVRATDGVAVGAVGILGAAVGTACLSAA